MPVKLFYGNEEFLLNAELQKFKNTALKGDKNQLNRKVCKEKINIYEIIEAIETPAMLFGNTLIEVYSNTLFTRGKAEDEKAVTELINVIENLNDNVFVAFICIFPKDETKKIDSAKKLVKTIQKIGEIKEFTAFKFYETDKIVSWIMQQAKSKKIKLPIKAAQLLQTHTGNDLRMLDSELEKLKTYILPSDEVTEKDVEDLMQDNEDVFKVMDYWLLDRKDEMLIELNKLLQKQHEQLIVAMFQTTAKRWLRIKLESEYSDAKTIAQIIGMHPFFVQNEIIKLNKTTQEKLSELRKNLNKADFDMKTGNIMPKLALEMALTQC